MSWEFFTKDDDDFEGEENIPNMPMSSLLPSSIQEAWGGNNQNHNLPEMPQMRQQNVRFGANSYNFPSQTNGIIPGSAPVPSNSIFDSDNITFQGVIELEGFAQSSRVYYKVQFNQLHSDLFHPNRNIKIELNDYVLTEADRGYDIGKVVEIVRQPSIREAQNAKRILRLATQHEVAQLPEKAKREQRALEIGKSTAMNFKLPMEITAAEFQFDGNKLTFYYKASSYVDFRNLVRALFRIFQIRIWMQAAPHS